METKRAANIFEVLSSGIRLDIFRLLVRSPAGLFAGEIAKSLNIPPTNLSFHLKAIAGSGLASIEKEGRFVRYKADTVLMRDVLAYLAAQCEPVNVKMQTPSQPSIAPVKVVPTWAARWADFFFSPLVNYFNKYCLPVATGIAKGHSGPYSVAGSNLALNGAPPGSSLAGLASANWNVSYILLILVVLVAWGITYSKLAPVTDYLVYDLFRLVPGSAWADAMELCIYNAAEILLLLVAMIYALAWIRASLNVALTRTFLLGKHKGVEYFLGAGLGAVAASLPEIFMLKQIMRWKLLLTFLAYILVAFTVVDWLLNAFSLTLV